VRTSILAAHLARLGGDRGERFGDAVVAGVRLPVYVPKHLRGPELI
jgi:hypothetical protein